MRVSCLTLVREFFFFFFFCFVSQFNSIDQFGVQEGWFSVVPTCAPLFICRMEVGKRA